MGGDQVSPTPAPPPATPDYAAANKEGVQAEMDALPLKNKLNAAAQLGQKYTDPDTGKVYDFTGVGNSDLSLAQAKSNAQTADLSAQSALDLGSKYGQQFSDQAQALLKEQDPVGFQLRKDLAQKTSDELAAGGNLTDDENAQVEKQIRGGQAARGNILGNAPTSQEVLAKTGLSQQLLQQRMANAQSYALSAPLSAQYASLSGAQQGAAPNQATAVMAGQMNPNAGQLGANFAQQSFGTGMSGYNAGLGYTLGAAQYNASQNPWLMGASMGGTAVGAAAKMYTGGCWVAEELFGKDSEKTHEIRAFCKNHIDDDGWLGDFMRLYFQKGERWAEEIKHDPDQREQALMTWNLLHRMAVNDKETK